MNKKKAILASQAFLWSLFVFLFLSWGMGIYAQNRPNGMIILIAEFILFFTALGIGLFYLAGVFGEIKEEKKEKRKEKEHKISKVMVVTLAIGLLIATYISFGGPLNGLIPSFKPMFISIIYLGIGGFSLFIAKMIEK